MESYRGFSRNAGVECICSAARCSSGMKLDATLIPLSFRIQPYSTTGLQVHVSFGAMRF